jgi:hypothetical protein
MMPENKEELNPYQQGRDHESQIPMDRDDVLAVAGLLGTVNGALGEIDKRNLGGVQAKQMDPKLALQKIAAANGAIINQQPIKQPTQQIPQQSTIPVTGFEQAPTNQKPVQDNGYTTELEKRVRALEAVVESYKKVEKFKRGVGYSINTAKIKGEFRDPSTILDIISTELAKNTKTITLKLINATAESKKQE